MLKHKLNEECLAAFRQHLYQEERAAATLQKYLRDIELFLAWLGGRAVSKEEVLAWKACLLQRSLAPSTVNNKLSSLNGLFIFLGWHDCRVKFLRLQKRVFRNQRLELTREEYRQLVATALAQGRERLALVIETICSTGIRVSEVRYITVEAACQGLTEVALKGKIRTILLPAKLCRKLRLYAQEQGIPQGQLFRTASGEGLSRRQIWGEMKRLCQAAQVEPSKVFPHNLRHLFALTYYYSHKDLVKLAAILGHSSIETTRLYLISSGVEHAKSIEELGLVY